MGNQSQICTMCVIRFASGTMPDSERPACVKQVVEQRQRLVSQIAISIQEVPVIAGDDQQRIVQNVLG